MNNLNHLKFECVYLFSSIGDDIYFSNKEIYFEFFNTLHICCYEIYANVDLCLIKNNYQNEKYKPMLF